MDDVNWAPILPGDEFPAALEALLEDWSLEPDRYGIDVNAPVSRAMSPDVPGELYAVGRFGDESPVYLVYVLATYGRLGPDALGRVEYVTTILDVAPEYRGDYGDPALFLEWAGRRTLRRLAEVGPPVATTPGAGDPTPR